MPNLPIEDELRSKIYAIFTDVRLDVETQQPAKVYAENASKVIELIHHYTTKRELEAELRGRIIEACRQHDVKYASDGCQFCDGDAYSAEHDVDISHIQDMESKLKAQKEQENKS